MWRRVPKKRIAKRKLSFWDREQIFNSLLAFLFVFGLGGSFVLLFVKLFALTVVRGGFYKKLSDNNRIKEMKIEAPRGAIYDRKGYVLVKSQIEAIGGEGEVVKATRVFFFKSAPHFLGYIQEADKKDLENQSCFYSLELGDRVGKAGVEKLLDCVLRGKNGRKLIEVNALGKRIRELAVYPPIKGLSIQTTLDSKLQEKVRELVLSSNLKNKKISIVALKPDDGEILVYFSYPDYDPEIFLTGSDQEIREVLSSEDNPMFDRVARGVYPPGSTFKPFVAIAALEEGVIDEKTVIEDTGIVKVGPQTFGNWYFLEYGKKEGLVDVITAIKRSNDIFFYKIGEKLGEKKIRDWAVKFGFSRLTGIGFPEEIGVVPSDFWKRSKMGQRWYLGDTYNLSIGQGFLLVTPLQLAVATASIANGGYLCKPIILKPLGKFSYPRWAQEIVTKYSTPECQGLNISQKNLQIVREGMKQTCEPRGTAYPFFNFKVKVGCKTGTAESHAPSGIPHAWFTVFAPFDKPEIALVVLVEEGGQGSDVAAPLAKKILEFYFERKD